MLGQTHPPTYTNETDRAKRALFWLDNHVRPTLAGDDLRRYDDARRRNVPPAKGRPTLTGGLRVSGLPPMPVGGEEGQTPGRLRAILAEVINPLAEQGNLNGDLAALLLEMLRGEFAAEYRKLSAARAKGVRAGKHEEQ